ncbi:ferredoxin [Streptomyces sp. NPDC058086]|uniref:ferredoxin n=1 Tax=Streptomyces sp. NPDC058086 TaxID=3346334 RepID=UPI0036E9176E
MQTVVDLTRCQGYAQRVFLAAEVFELPGEEGLLCATTVPDEQVERVRQAAAARPVQVILLGEEVSDGARRPQGRPYRHRRRLPGGVEGCRGAA